MRLLVVPLSVRTSMVYCQTAALPRARQTPRLDERLVERANKTWNKFAESDKQWQRKIVDWGNLAMERISYNEWGLKTIPERGKYLRRIKPAEDAAEAEAEHISVAEFEKREDLKSTDLEQVRVDFPGSVLSSLEAESRLRTLANHGIAHHTKYFWLSTIGAPLTLPVALLPVVPNLPGFYMLFRMWSNWRARDGAKHLKYLVDGSHLNFYSDPKLDAVYGPLLDGFRPSENGGGDNAGPDRMLLRESAIDDLVKAVNVPELGPELHRAVRQVQRALKKDQAQGGSSSSDTTENPNDNSRQ